MTGTALRQKRVSAEIPGSLVASRASISRGRLSEIERGLIEPTEEEVKRLDNVLNELIAAREKVAAIAAEVGYPM